MIFVDLDGVLFNFNKKASEVHNKPYEEYVSSTLEKDWNMSASHFWKVIDSHGENFWADLEPYPWFNELINLCPDFVIATSPSLSHYAGSGKILSLQKAFGKRFRRYFIGPQKWHLGKPGSILIDDMDKNCDKFRENGGEAIVFPQFWNSNAHLVPNRIEYIKEQLEDIKCLK